MRRVGYGASRVLDDGSTMQRDNLITTSIAARILGVAEGTVRQLERRGVIHAMRAGAIRLFDRSEIEAAALSRQAQRAESGHEAA